MIIRKYLDNTIYLPMKLSKTEVLSEIRIHRPEVYKLNDRLVFIKTGPKIYKIEITLPDNKDLTWNDLNDILKYREVIK